MKRERRVAGNQLTRWEGLLGLGPMGYCLSAPWQKWVNLNPLLLEALAPVVEVGAGAEAPKAIELLALQAMGSPR